MKAVGVHTYAGGFLLGLQEAGVDVVGSVETYKNPMEVAKELGIKRIEQPEPVVLCVGNPPCSRFSFASHDHYTVEQQNDLGTYQELMDVLVFGGRCGADVIWWETGPLCFTRGRGMITAAHKKVGELMGGPVTTVVLKYDCVYGGHPQRRIRTHVIHMRGEKQLPKLPAATPLTGTLWEFVQQRAGKLIGISEAVYPYSKKMGGFVEDPRVWWRAMHGAERKFQSTLPKVFDKTTRFASNVFGGRWFAWDSPSRFWRVAEYAALMGYPAAVDYSRFHQHAHYHDWTWWTLTQSVAPPASRWIFQNVVAPTLSGAGDSGGVVLPELDHDHSIAYYRLFDGKLRVHTVECWEEVK